MPGRSVLVITGVTSVQPVCPFYLRWKTGHQRRWPAPRYLADASRNFHVGRLGVGDEVTVEAAVAEVNDEADDEPDDEANPGHDVQKGHHSEADQYSENRHKGHQRRFVG